MINETKIAAMREGGKRLATVRLKVIEAVVPGVSFEHLEEIAQEWIKKLHATPSFPTVDGYKYATCITKNEGCCHGLPVGKVVEEGDLITVDVGLIFDGYHTDTSITVFAGNQEAINDETREFLETGKRALANAISKAKVGNSVYDISRAIEETIEGAGYGAVYQLTGHGVGKKLHEPPYIPCVAFKQDKRLLLTEGQTIAIEPMYSMGNPELVLGADGWVYETKDKSLTGMFEETVLITRSGPEILTKE